MWKIKIGSIVRYADENFVVQVVYDDGHIGVYLRNGVYSEIHKSSLQTKKPEGDATSALGQLVDSRV